eukprot:Hpha_TRINITY_DN24297_c0_g1::TRINITY_DN24297_c0_g1_i1::g.35998::m.35998
MPIQEFAGVPFELRSALRGLLNSGVILLCVAKCKKVSNSGRQLPRIVGVAQDFILISDMRGNARRMIKLATVNRLLVADKELAILMPEHPPDVWLCFDDQGTVDRICAACTRSSRRNGMTPPRVERLEGTLGRSVQLAKPPGYRVHLEPLLITDSVCHRPSRNPPEVMTPDAESLVVSNQESFQLLFSRDAAAQPPTGVAPLKAPPPKQHSVRFATEDDKGSTPQSDPDPFPGPPSGVSGPSGLSSGLSVEGGPDYLIPRNMCGGAASSVAASGRATGGAGDVGPAAA